MKFTLECPSCNLPIEPYQRHDCGGCFLQFTETSIRATELFFVRLRKEWNAKLSESNLGNGFSFIPFNHWRSGLYWGFGTVRKRDGQPTAAGPFCYLVRTETGEIERWEGNRTALPELSFDEQVRAERV